ncbi:MAG: two-component system response regulator [Burkholderia sp.]|nr:two-component system response regulator [Burkholderia sp.]
MIGSSAVQEEMASRPARILFVDDEPNILSSLRRLFRPLGYEVLTAESGSAGLEIMKNGPVDVVISDMRMPEMHGARFLELVRASWPQTMRLLLTGYADIGSILDAINRGEIYRYITKPWDETDILLVVRHALERKAIEQERQRLESLAQWQNEKLKGLNAALEMKVEQRTAALKKAHDNLLLSNEKLKANFLTSIKVFSNMIELRGQNLAGHSRRVADLARRIAVKMGLEGREAHEVFIAGLLHNIGKIGFSDDLLTMPVSLMKSEDLGRYRKYPARGEQLLMPLEDLREPAKIVRSHQERFDGKGFPDGLAGFDIPIGARILALASDYYNLQIGAFAQRCLRPEEATAMILQNRGTRYDSLVVDAFDEIVHGRITASTTDGILDMAVDVAGLRAGMVTSRDLITREGSLLLSADHVLSERLIQQLTNFQRSSETSLTVYIRSDRNKS